MSRSTKQPIRSSSGKTTKKTTAKRTSRHWAWLGFAAPVLIIGVFVGVGVSTFEPQHGLMGSDAPRFNLPTSAGSEVALDQVLAGGNEAMLYFSMGVGCDGCFAQIPEIDEALAARGVTLVSVMVDPADVVADESVRFGIADPILIDEDRAVSEAYQMLGIYGHSDRPSHSFALVGRDGQVKWVKHYASMFVPAAEFIAEVPGI
jgi:peroxiredoxin